ncbi:MAG: SOS response-associated peptidase [Gammaproteobacteria bacterium]|nr:SOS response-associated peptidase [Pseudomonadales bacterium]
MCGRYSNHVKSMLDWSALLGDWPEDIPERHNIAPGQLIAGFTPQGGLAMRWGLVPPWSDDLSGKYATFNARIETVADKPAYRHAWQHDNRCVIPALGYFEWRAMSGGKQPFFIRAENTSPLLFAGLFEPERDAGIPASCTLLTRPARADLAAIHPRMPVTLSLEDARSWLAVDRTAAAELMAKPVTLDLQSYPVSRQVNNARNEGDDLVQPVELS